MAKKKAIKKTIESVLVEDGKVLSYDEIEENEVLAYLSKKGIAERDHLNLSLDRVELLLSSLRDKGLIEGSGGLVKC